MMRGKDDEKTMFPRLHVNDKETGGPRAPPRNKMTLYEQLSIPSQRFNHGANSSNSNNLAPEASSNQGGGSQRNTRFPHYVPHSKPTQLTEFHNGRSDRGSLSTSLPETRQPKKIGDEDDFTVPVLVQSGIGQHSASHREEDMSFDPNYASSVNIQYAGDSDQQHVGSIHPGLRQDVRIHIQKDLGICGASTNHTSISSTNLATIEKIPAPAAESEASPSRQCQDKGMVNLHRSHKNDESIQPKSSAEFQVENNGNSDGVTEKHTEIGDPKQVSHSHMRKDWTGLYEPETVSDYHGDKTFGLAPLGNGDTSNDVSESSMLDSISALDISPDDVVEVIGQKQFWKARKAIVNQQRVFAVQVFELHRLIKVQRGIAGSPHILVEEGAYLGRTSTKGIPAKNLPSEAVVGQQLHVAKRKDDFEKKNHRIEQFAENAVGKTSFSSVTNGSQLSNYGPYSGNPTAAPGEMGPWCFSQPNGQQWLVPVMSPSEGLVYKPFTAQGQMGPAWGGCGPFGQTPVTGNFMSPAYGHTASPHHQGFGVPPGAPMMAHGYFPQYGMPIMMNPALSGVMGEQMNYFRGSGQKSGGGVDSNTQHQSSCNVPTQKAVTTRVRKFLASKDSEVQGSTGNSSAEKLERVGTVQASNGRETSPLSPMTTSAPAEPLLPQERYQSPRVIKVVPHNRRSATESAARIFQSIQEGRQHHDSI